MLFPLYLPDAAVQYLPGWLTAADANQLMGALQADVRWQVHRIRMFGSWVDLPRLSCWVGDPQACYCYSGAEFRPHPWSPALQAVRERLQAEDFGRFNSVLLNRYRDGRDSMGWHSDDEPELGPTPVIASLSLGAARRFLLRRRDDPALRADLMLGHGDLLLMAGQTQRFYQHALPKAARIGEERINLTFRLIHSRASGERTGP